MHVSWVWYPHRTPLESFASVWRCPIEKSVIIRDEGDRKEIYPGCTRNASVPFHIKV